MPSEKADCFRASNILLNAARVKKDELRKFAVLYRMVHDRTFSVFDQTIVGAGLLMSRRYQISYYDGAIVAAAERLGAPIFFTEDLNHNQLYGSVRVVNPFIEH